MSSATTTRASRSTRHNTATPTSLRKTRQGSSSDKTKAAALHRAASKSISKNATASEIDTDDENHRDESDVATIQSLRDELEELTDTKDRLEDKVIQLEERIQFLEASSRLDASKQAAEIMDLKEKARKLEIDLSTVIDERDFLEQENEQLKAQVSDTEVRDQARQISTQLQDAWIRIAAMKASQEEYVQKLFKAEEANLKLQAEMAKVVDLSNSAKNLHMDEKQRWEYEKQELLAGNNSLKQKLAQASTDGDKQVLDWEQDQARVRNSLKHGRDTWDKEKKGFLDQIASLKVKVSALSVKKTAPPEWILEKHRLLEQCATLQSRVASLESDRATSVESDRASANAHESTNIKKLESEKQKLEKKVGQLKEKLFEVMEHALKTQAQVDQRKTRQDVVSKKQPGTSQRPRAPARKSTRSADRESGSDDGDAEGNDDVPEETTLKESKQPISRTRARRNAAENVTYTFGSSSSDKSKDSSEDEDEDQEENQNGDDDGHNAADHEHNEGQSADEDIEMQEPEADAGPSSQRGEPKEASNVIEDQEQEDAKEKGFAPLARSKRGAPDKFRKANDNNSDSDFEPPQKKTVAAPRNRGGTKKTSGITFEPAHRKTKTVLSNKVLALEGEATIPQSSTTKKTILSAPETTATISKEISAASATVSVAPSSGASTSNPTRPIAVNTPVNVTDAVESNINKVKKRRKLLTGKGVEELGDILNGPGSSLSSTPSSGLVFDKAKVRSKGSSSTPLGATSNPAKLEALNAIKMAFALPKPRNNSSSYETEA
ncbi:hypothetical protein BX616_003961 [Lobosporangium transversale]|uniref:Uncharacterized protein n=1 Tax=Lobosporangium transversale TaxID=64571 RepID=A0A1Y2GNV6_9FUNG|nr:hypothetical protein BCR41DRAFT_422235 [Lobosporangium transversale]KAF9898484.1 hypothetical protein BX616_003961 [Lobosporangium transversale]ORZ15441.1 hypothetical protein BCR41DRAFT_422235 [Lobosporangium transversale]|eukprot:XP_021881189.1 hypothetical protein BCR41DRAFT_422235 [Lobosporangium transversale]